MGVYCEQKLEIPADKFNVNGGACALGHPLGATGARLVVTILNELERRNQHVGVVSMCIGLGMGAGESCSRVPAQHGWLTCFLSGRHHPRVGGLRRLLTLCVNVEHLIEHCERAAASSHRRAACAA
jgi:hypothetical protein